MKNLVKKILIGVIISYRRSKIKSDSKKYFRKSLNEYSAKQEGKLFPIDKKRMFPVLDDIYKEAGDLDTHYFLQDLVMAKEVVKRAPEVHYDIGSRVDGFIAHLLSSQNVGKVVELDVRPLSIDLDGLDFIQTNATSLDNIEDDSLESISSLHAIEHFGLGRYGDEIDPEGWRKALLAIQSKVKKGGYFYFSVPVGPENVLCFNAHRIFAPNTIISTLDEMKLVSFRYIHAMKVTDVNVELYDKLNTVVHEYDCGLFIFTK